MQHSDFYNQNASSLVTQYYSLSFEDVHACWRDFWPGCGDRVLDVGAGSGRDACWMAARGCLVVAVEPAALMRAEGQRLTGDTVEWLDDALPELSQLAERKRQFDVILVSAVWMHLTPEQRQQALGHLAALLTSEGRLVISLRDGEFSDGRVTYPLSVEELVAQSAGAGLKPMLISERQGDGLKRSDVSWQTVVLSLLDPILNVVRE
ncbi:class I SAM-dependent methyltransferase [Vibrio gazogenes]|uniref:Methyltransferase n=1 Tax=Vibrio gazogenes TaxID=687 RepID=A0A1Z2SJ34_VIBGA|nr:class I SAM-dependent methyltransferase [Vibrio gazogenes]ASA57200.1 methyltransferase [Vibrio gazogenes]